MDRIPTQRLTNRETEVLRLIGEGNSSREVADALCIDKRTVDFHLCNAYRKLKVNNRIKACNEAKKLGYL